MVSLNQNSSSAGTPTLPIQQLASPSSLDADQVINSSLSQASQGGVEIQRLPDSAMLESPAIETSLETLHSENEHEPAIETSIETLELRNQYAIPEDPTVHIPTLSKSSSQIWDGAGSTTPNAIVDNVETGSSAPQALASIKETRPVMHPRQSSTGSASEMSESGQTDGDKASSSRTRTTDQAKVRHNIVERRYRDNINAQVDVLRDSIVATMEAKSSRLGADELKRLTKAAVIAAATHQIKRARIENDKLLNENRELQAQIAELEKLVKCGECPLMQLSVDMHLNSSMDAS